MRLRQIQDFVAIVEAGSIHAAARKSGVSQPAMTKSVRELEAELQVQLLRRSNRGVVPTPAGRSFFARARVAHGELEKAREELARSGDAAGRTVAFGIGPTAGRLITADAIADFRRQHPTTQIRILEGFPVTLLPLVREETLDFAIGPLPDGPLQRAFSSAGLPYPRVMIQCESHNVALAILAKTDMLGIISNRLLASTAARDLQPISVKESLPSYTTGIFTRKDLSLTRPAAALARALTLAARRLVR